MGGLLGILPSIGDQEVIDRSTTRRRLMAAGADSRVRPHLRLSTVRCATIVWIWGMVLLISC